MGELRGLNLVERLREVTEEMKRAVEGAGAEAERHSGALIFKSST
jgi:hypothetical protein